MNLIIRINLRIIMGAGKTVQFTNRIRKSVKLSFVKCPPVKYNIRENTNREIIINRCVISYNVYGYIIIIN